MPSSVKKDRGALNRQCLNRPSQTKARPRPFEGIIRYLRQKHCLFHREPCFKYVLDLFGGAGVGVTAISVRWFNTDLGDGSWRKGLSSFCVLASTHENPNRRFSVGCRSRPGLHVGG
jgi:hypothetical protein